MGSDDHADHHWVGIGEGGRQLGARFLVTRAFVLRAVRCTAFASAPVAAGRRQFLAANTAYAEVRGASVAALLPATWRPSPIVHGVRFSE